MKKNNVFLINIKKYFLKQLLSDWKKSSFMWSLFLTPILEVIFLPIPFFLFSIYGNCSKNNVIYTDTISNTILHFPLFLTSFFIKSVIFCISALFIGCLFLKFPRGKHMFFVLEPMMTIFISFASLIYLFFIPNEKIPPVNQIWRLIIYAFDSCK